MLLPPETLARIKDDTERGDRDRHVYVDHCAVLLAAVEEAIKRGSVLTAEPAPHADVDTERLYGTTNARVWAEEFAKVHPEVDQGFMIGWFANAFVTAERHAGEDHARRIEEVARQLDRALDEIDGGRVARRIIAGV